MINKKNIPLHYMIPLQGKMNRGVYDCFESGCHFEPTHRKSPYSVVEDIIGFANSNIGKMVIWECKGCGEKYFFHLRENDIFSNIDYVNLYHQFLTTGKWEYL